MAWNARYHPLLLQDRQLVVAILIHDPASLKPCPLSLYPRTVPCTTVCLLSSLNPDRRSVRQDQLDVSSPPVALSRHLAPVPPLPVHMPTQGHLVILTMSIRSSRTYKDPSVPVHSAPILIPSNHLSPLLVPWSPVYLTFPLLVSWSLSICLVQHTLILSSRSPSAYYYYYSTFLLLSVIATPPHTLLSITQHISR